MSGDPTSETVHRIAFETTRAGVIVQAGDGAIVRWNERAPAILGLTPDQLAGRASIDPEWRCVHRDGSPYPGGDHPAMVAIRDRVVVSDEIMGVHRPDGELRWLRVSAHPIDDAASGGRVVATFEDVTDLLAIERLKESFISLVSHELRTPLTSIRAALALLESRLVGRLDDAGWRLMGIAASNTDRLQRLIEELLDLERIQAGTFTLAQAESSAPALVERALHPMTLVADDAGVSITVGELPAVALWVDADRVVQAVRHLVENAITFAGEGGEVRVDGALDADGRQVLLRVADSGPGIDRADVAHVFDGFWQADGDDTRRVGGAGVGLTIVRAVAEQHGGTATVRSEPGAGAEFTISLPVLRVGRAAA